MGRPLQLVPGRIQKELRNKEVRALYKIGYTMGEISSKLNISRTSVFFAIRGRKLKGKTMQRILNTKNKSRNYKP